MTPPEKALKGQYPDFTLSGLIDLTHLNNRAMPYPDAFTLSGQSNNEKV